MQRRSPAGAAPSFKGRYGFPGSACISIDEKIVHGIPSPKLVLRDCEIVTVDIGLHYEGFHTDSASTYGVGTVAPETRRLREVTEVSCWAGITAATLGNHIGDIGAFSACRCSPRTST